MKLIPILLSLFLAVTANAQAFQGPLLITKAGTYTGNYRSNDPNTAAITVSCYDSVIITGCNIESAGIGIKAYGGTKMNIHHNTIKGLMTTAQRGRALDDYHPQSLTFENNMVERTGGLLVDHNDENTKSAIIRYNIIKNTDKRRPDGSEGDHRAGILFNTVTTIFAEIAWNQFTNDVDSSWIEDNINLGNTGGTPEAPIRIHDNYIKGAYPVPYNYNTGNYTGSGITVEGEPGTNHFNNVSRYIKIYNNQVISTMNGGINVNTGHNIEVTGNTIISSGMIPSGQYSRSFWAGGAIWNGSNLSTSVFKDIIYKDNTVGYYREGVSVGGANRQDWTFVSGSPISVDLSQNISLPNPITLATEQAEWPKWLAKLAANKIVVGNAVNNPVIVTPSDTTVITLPGTVTVGKTITGTITPTDSAGKSANYKLGTIKVTSDALTSVIFGGFNERTFTVTGIAPGTSTVTVTFTNLYNELITKVVTVTVVPQLDRATSANITWQ